MFQPYLDVHTRGDGVDRRSDLYTLGVMLFQLVTGRLPFDGRSAAEIATRRLTEPAPPARFLAPDLPEGANRRPGR